MQLKKNTLYFVIVVGLCSFKSSGGDILGHEKSQIIQIFLQAIFELLVYLEQAYIIHKLVSNNCINAGVQYKYDESGAQLYMKAM